MEKVQGQSIFQRTAYKTRRNTRARFLTHACVLSRSMCAIPLDHHLTTPSFQPVLYIIFYAPTFFYNHHKQRRKLCTPHNFRRRVIVFSRSSQFSDPEGRWFESSRAHHNKGAVSIRGCCSFVVLFFKTVGRCGQKVGLDTLKREIERCIQKNNITKLSRFMKRRNQ